MATQPKQIGGTVLRAAVVATVVATEAHFEQS
jgi:hypothetical protein